MLPMDLDTTEWVWRRHKLGVALVYLAMAGLLVWAWSWWDGSPIGWLFWASVGVITAVSLWVHFDYFLGGGSDVE